MRQEVLKDVDIFYSIQQELKKAKEEILVITAWFTDRDLLNILEQKQSEGVIVKVIIADNEENSKTDFNSLINEGGSVYKLSSKGTGMLHEKFCVIDSKIAIHGSYNWTYNARKNNKESVIITSHSNTIAELKENFNEMENIELSKLNGHDTTVSNINTVSKTIEQPSEIKPTEKPQEVSTYSKSTKEFERILDGLIESEIFQFDKNAIEKEGFERAKSTNGDHHTLSNTLDTLYADFVNSLDIAQEKKEKLKLRIEELKKLKINKLDLEKEQEIYVEELETNAKKTSVQQDIKTKDVDISHKEIEIEKIQKTRIEQLKTKSEKLKENINALRVEFVKNKLRWHELIPALVVALIMLIYIVVFYSSAAYILIYSKLDAKLAEMKGMQVVPVEVFDSLAIGKAFDKGGSAPLFIFLFVIIPIGLAIGKMFFKKVTKWTHVAIWTLILAVDSLLAYVVAKSIHEVDYLAGNTEEVWQFSHFYKNENFYLVFALGALGLVIFKFAFEKIQSAFDERNGDLTRAKNEVLIKQYKEQISDNEDEINELDVKISDINKEIVSLKASKDSLEKDYVQLPHTYERKKQFITNQFNNKSAEIEDVVSMYESKIDNNDLKFSVSALKDRVNTFIEGWVDYLHDTYSRHKAIEMSSEANKNKEQWLETKLN